MRISEIIVETQLDEINLFKAGEAGLEWLAKSVPFLKSAGTTAGKAAVDTAKILGKAGTTAALNTGRAIGKNVVQPAALGAGFGAGMIGAGYLAAKDAIDTLSKWGGNLVKDLNIPNDILSQIGQKAAEFGIPVLAAIAIVYGGKMVYDWLSGNDKEKQKAVVENFFAERGAASRALCLSKRSDRSLGASQLASCKSQGLRARDGNKSHKIGNKRIIVGGKKIKGKKYHGPLPDYS